MKLLENSVSNLEEALDKKRERLDKFEEEIRDLDGEKANAKEEQITKLQAEIERDEQVLQITREIVNTQEEMEESSEEEKESLKERIKSLRNRRDQIKDDFEKSFGKAADTALDTFLGENQMLTEIGMKLMESGFDLIKTKESVTVKTSQGEIKITRKGHEFDVTSPKIERIYTNTKDLIKDLVRLNESSFGKKDLANMYTINNVRNKTVSEDNISDNMVDFFNENYSLVLGDKNFDPFGDGVDDINLNTLFIELLVKTMENDGKDLLFEASNTKKLIDEGVVSNFDKIKESIKESQSSNRVFTYNNVKLKESLGNKFKMGSPYRKLKEARKI